MAHPGRRVGETASVRQLAAALVSLGLVLAAAAALVPVSIDVEPWEDGRCGPPAVRLYAHETVEDQNEQARIDRCEGAARTRMVVAGAMVIAGLIAGLLALMRAWRNEAAARRRRARARQERAARAREAARGGQHPAPSAPPVGQTSS